MTELLKCLRNRLSRHTAKGATVLAFAATKKAKAKSFKEVKQLIKTVDTHFKDSEDDEDKEKEQTRIPRAQTAYSQKVDLRPRWLCSRQKGKRPRRNFSPHPHTRKK